MPKHIVTHAKVVDVYLNSEAGKFVVSRQGEEAAREFAGASFAGVWPSPEAWGRHLWASWDEATRTDWAESHGEDEPGISAAVPATTETLESLMDGIYHGRTVDFITEPEGVYVYDENAI